jgi:endonuclease/exonuclease/phosphatase family metal-dependent hydrolase
MAAKQVQSTLVSIVAAVALLIVGIIWYINEGREPESPPRAGDVHFCFWNVENLFDDDNREKDLLADKDYDDWFSTSPEDLKRKLDKHAEVLLALNKGIGPDIIALVEVESVRAAEMLKDHLNQSLTDPNTHYKHVLMKEVAAGRHIAPAVITRLDVVGDRTDQLGDKTRRILKAVIKANGKELVVIVAHWRSRVEQGGDTGEKGRANYADDIYGAVKAMYLSNKQVDVLVCGDFNDDPTDVSVTQHLHATGVKQLVLKPDGDLFLFNLSAGRDPQTFGTHYHSKWHIFDQIVVSPGMLDGQGWNCDPDSLQTIKKLTASGGTEISLESPTGKIGRPWNFGKKKDYGGNPAKRGYSDHFPVSVKLSVSE